MANDPGQLVRMIRRVALDVLDDYNVANVVKLATVSTSHTPGQGKCRLRFDGEGADSVKLYPCLSSYRARPGDRVVLVRAGTRRDSWVVLGSMGDTGWIPVTNFQNGWVNFGGSHMPAAYRRDGNGRVHVRGLVKDGAVGSGQTVFTLPEGFRPSHTLIFGVATGTSGISAPVVGRTDVLSSGAIRAVSGNTDYRELNFSFDVL